MRKTLNISMSPTIRARVDYLVKSGKYSTASELFRDALRALEDTKLIEGIKESETEFASGKGRRLRSLRDLM